jgi:hypothetical protein
MPLALVVLAAHPLRRGLERVGLLAAGAIVGSYWSLENLHVTGTLVGGLEEGKLAWQTPGAVVTSIGRLARRSYDLPGAAGGWFVAYAVVAGALAAAAVVAWLRGRRPRARIALGAAAVTIGVPGVAALAASLDGVELDAMRAVAPEFRTPDSTATWYGPAGVFAVLTATALLGWRLRAHRTRLRDVLLAAAPLLQLVLLGATLIYDPYRGRFVMPAMALSAATWGVLLSRRALALGLVSLTVVTGALSVRAFDAKPLGFPRGGSLATMAPWGKPRWYVQTVLRPDNVERRILHFFDRHVPERATVALALNQNDFLSPYFGPHRTRTVLLVPERFDVADEADWLVIARGRNVGFCASDWRQAYALRNGWRVLRRVAHGSCG